jgi:serine/threonine-protein kinase
MLGGTVKSYQVWGQISQGGMSDVWLARHAELAFPVILKTMRPRLGETFETQYARLLSEARLMGRLTSPHVVRVLDIGELDPTGGRAPFLVEEYVDGIDLGELDRRRRSVLKRPIPLWAVARLVAQAAEGLHAAHQVGVVHRDVKPSNLFGCGHGSLKVGDFGVAMASGSDCPVPAGTPVYMAPEQLAGDRVDRRADIYSLGATAYVLRYGSAPFPAARAVDAEAPVPFPTPRSPEEAFFQHVIGKMLARRPDARYAHMAVPGQKLESLADHLVPHASASRVAAADFQVGGTRVSFEVGDLAQVQSDAVVNSAYTSMRMRSGVGDALRRRGGDGLEVEAMQGGERALGDCVLTGPGTLPVRGVIHAVAAWNEVSCVARSTHRALLLAEAQGFCRIAFPALGTGQGRVALEASMDASLRALWLHLGLGGSKLQEVRFVFLDQERYERALEVGLGILSGSSDPRESVSDPVLDLDDAHAPTLFGQPPKREGGQRG